MLAAPVRTNTPCLHRRLLDAYTYQALPPLIPMLYVFTLPESPRYILQTAIRLRAVNADLKEVARCIERAHASLKRLNRTELQATRELFMIYHSLEQENVRVGRDHRWYKTSILQLFTHQRSRHAMYASVTVMFLQQFCGVNVLAYYSTTVIQDTLPSGQALTNRSPYLVRSCKRAFTHSQNTC